jgi:hypothetical protein
MSEMGPMLELAVFARPAWLGDLLEPLPEIDRALFAEGIPRRFIGRWYWAAHDLSVIERTDGSRILRFGFSGLFSEIGLDLASAEVIAVVNSTPRTEFLVNSSLEQFTSTVDALIARFPFYDADAERAELNTIGSELLGTIRSIDPEAAVADRFWSSFVDDAEMGDLSTEDVLEAMIEDL